jgi:hypothetical protein
MSTHVILFGWNRSIPGRESTSASHFDEFSQYLASLQGSGQIEGFDVVFLDPHGGDMNGFFLIRGDRGQLDALASTEEWITHMTRGALHLEGAGAIRGVTGEGVGGRMTVWKDAIPS